ncbi:dermonecrotic toxin domain-containing protein [Pseudomonas sp. NY11955]|uniref:dermonecrotic toxin domain-containing protein n=1 Tax=Pseudomonas sp. NY11955 TaxID=3400363 RepID=UPI003A83ACA2
MNGNQAKMRQDLELADAARPLVALVDKILRDYPDPYVLASQHAAQIVRKHIGKEMDPRFVWWHQFNTASTSSRSFTGWQHSGPPQKSLVLSELVVERFDAHFQDATDELDQLGGFYRQGPHAAFFDERNEIPMLGSDVQKDLWALDFATLYRAQVERFWSVYASEIRVLAKVNLLGATAGARLAGRVSVSDRRLLRALAVDNLADDERPTLSKLQKDSTGQPLTVSRYVFGAGDRGSMFGLRAPNGRVVAYLPWAEEALTAFESELAMARWLAAKLRSEDALTAFIAGAHSNPYDTAGRNLIRVHLRGIANSRSDEAALIALKLFERPLRVDLFTYMADQAKAEMRHVAEMMRDNARLRRVMLSGYLSAFLGIFGSFVPFGWPMTLMLLGASIGKVALDLDEAWHATDEHTRKRALRSAMLQSVFASLYLIDLSAQSTVETMTAQAAPHETGVALEHWQVSTDAELPVEGQELNAIQLGEVGTDGRMRGIRMSDDGSCWIDLKGHEHRVRYSHDLGVWLVVPTDNPYAFVPLKPVRLNEAGEWDLLVPPRLQGGSPLPAEGASSVRSPFWDVYTSVDDAKSTALSERALERQKRLLDRWPVAELQAGREPSHDARGLDCVNADGRLYYSYRYRREYFNSLIEWYTSNESKVNDVFRHGRYEYEAEGEDEDAYITDLADSLGRLPKSNQVTLYRGGNRSRGTGGESYRHGQLSIGDVLVNTDLTSFTENPYMASEFASLPFAGAPGAVPGLFDDSSVIFELPAGQYRDATPISAFSLYWKEAETLMLPGHYFRVEGLEQVYGDYYRFMKVTLKQVFKPATGRPVYDLRTGLAFDMETYRALFRTPSIVQRFFPD